MSTHRLFRVAAGTLAPVALAAVALVGASGPAQADSPPPPAAVGVLADTSAPGEVIATAAAPSRATTGIRAQAPRPRTIVVTGHGGRPVALVREGAHPLRVPRPGRAPATFTGLTPGATYTVIVGGLRVGAVTALDRPAPVSRVVVHRTPEVGTVQVTWQYRATRSAGRVGFDVVASAAGVPTVRTTVGDQRSTTLSGLRPDALYTFTVTPRNSAGAGRSTSAVMTRFLGGASPAPSPAAPAPAVPLSAPSPAPATRTIFVCPGGFTENAAGTCTSRLDYTFHEEATGPAPLLTSVETTIAACPAGANLEDYGWVMYCRTYGPVPTRTVKDPTPDGYTDTGTAWERTVPKDAVVVPA